LEKDAYLVLLKKDSHFVYDGRMYFLTNNASFFFFNYMPNIPSRSFLRVGLYLYNNNNNNKKKKEKKGSVVVVICGRVGKE